MEALEVRTMPMINRDITSILNVHRVDTRGAVEGTQASKSRLNGLGSTAMAVTANGTDANGNPGSPAISGYYGYTKINVMSSEAVEMPDCQRRRPVGIRAGDGRTDERHHEVRHEFVAWQLVPPLGRLRFFARPQFLARENNSVWNQFGGSLGGPDQDQ